MCSSQFFFQPSWDLDMYLPRELCSEDAVLYKSSEMLIRSINIDDMPLLAHRTESELFDSINDDVEAFSTLTDDEIFLMNNNNSHINDIADYCWKQSTVVPHVPNLSSESQLNISFPLSSSSSSNDMFKKRQSNISSPHSPTHSNYVNLRKFVVFDETTGRERRPLLHEFIRLVIENDEYSHIAEYIDRKQGIFKIHKPKDIAELWKHIKGRNTDKNMTYDKFARGIRYYYRSGIIYPNPGHFTFRFGLKSGFGIKWWPAY